MYTLSDLIDSGVLAGIRNISGVKDPAAIPISSVSIQELPEGNFIRKNELVLSTASGCIESKAAFTRLIKWVSSSGASALLLSFCAPDPTIPVSIIELSERLCLPLYVIPWECRFSDIIHTVNHAVNENKLKLYNELQNRLFTAISNAGSFDEALSAAENVLNSAGTNSDSSLKDINEDINKDVYDSFKTKGSRLETSSVSSEPVKALYELTLKTFYSGRDILEASIDLLVPLMDSTQNQKHGNSGSDLTATLSAYIRCGFNVSKAAKKLNIHRQSMIYRLHRIEDLTGLSLSDPDNIYLLWTALRVLNLN